MTPLQKITSLLILVFLSFQTHSQLIENYIESLEDHTMTTLKNGNIARIWKYQNSTAGNKRQIWLQSFDEENTPQSPRILIDEDTVENPSIGVLTNGKVAVSYSAAVVAGALRDGSGYGIMLVMCDEDLSSCDAPEQVNQDITAGDQTISTVGIFSDGDFAICWLSGTTLKGQIFEPDLNRVGSEVSVIATAIQNFKICIDQDDQIFVAFKKDSINQNSVARYDKSWSQIGLVTDLPTYSTWYYCAIRADGNAVVTRISLSQGENLYATVYDDGNNEVSDTLISAWGSSAYEGFSLQLNDGNSVVVFRRFQGGSKWEAFVHYLDEDFLNPLPAKAVSRGIAYEDRATYMKLAQFGSGKIAIQYSSTIGSDKYLAIGTICRFNSECDPLVAPVCGGITCDPCTDDSDCDADPALPFCETGAGGCADEEINISVISSMEDICQTGEIEIEVTTNFPSASFTVTVESSSGDTVNEANIDSHLSGFNSPGTATIPSEYFQADASYTFTVTSKRSAQDILVMDPEQLFTFNLSSTILSETLDQALSFEFSFLNCIKATPLTDTWDQDEGPSFSISGYLSDSVVNDTHTNFNLEVPECLLEPSTTYVFIYQYQIDAFPSVIAEINITIATKRLPITASISSVSEVESKNGLELIAIYDHNCPSIPDDDMEFKWKCEKKSPLEDSFFTDCQDPDSIFDQYLSGEASLQIPAKYYDPEETLSFILTIKYFEDTTNSDEQLIQVNSYLDIALQTPQVRRCSIRLILEYDQIEQQYSNDFVWELLSEHSETEKMEDLQDLMASVSIPSLVIPKKLIEIGAEYSIQASYVNFKGNQIVEVIDLDPVPELPYVTFDGGESQIVNSHVTNMIKAQTECFPEGLSQEWRFESGPDEFDINDFVSQSLPQWVQVPKCTLTPDSTYIISYIITSDKTSAESINEIELNVNPQTIIAQVNDGDTFHVENEDLELEIFLVTPGNCEIKDEDDFTYEWTCQKFLDSSWELSACTDDDNIFVTEYDTKELEVPESYFENGDTLRLEVEVNHDSDLITQTLIQVTITDKNIFKLKMLCESKFECLYFSPQINYIFEANITNRAEGFSGLETFWSLSPSFDKTFFANYMKSLVFPSPYFEQDSSQPLLSVSFQAQNDTHKSTIDKLIPINFSPEDGTITVTPNKGTIMQTQFTIQMQDWVDPDLPFEYQYFVADIEQDDEDAIARSYRPLTQFIKSPIISTILTTTKLDKSLTDLEIKGVARDAFGASNFATIECGLFIINLSINDEMKLIQDQLATISSLTDPLEKSKQIAVVSRHISNLEQKVIDEGDQQPCSCSDRGACVDQKCQCSEGFTLSECQLTDFELDGVKETKLAVLELMEQNLEQLVSADQSQVLSFQTLDELSENPEFNTEASINKTKTMMDVLIDKNSEEVVLSVESAKYVSSILDNLLNYQIANDCEASSNMTLSIRDDLEAYINKISEGLRSGKIVNENPEVLVEDTFSAQSQIVTECSIEDVEIQTDDNAPEVSFQGTLDDPDCARSLDLSYFAFQKSMFNCDTNGTFLNATKDIVMIQLTDSVTGENVTKDFDVLVSRIWNDTCFDGCQKLQDKKGRCLCSQDSSIFDIAGQISSLFEETNFNQIFSVDFDEWRIYDSAMFWLFAVMSFLTFGSYMLIKKKLTEYCFIDRAKQQGNVKGYQIFLGVFFVNHSLLNCFLIKNIQPGKLSRLLVFYTRLLLMMMIVSALGSKSGLSFGLRQLQDISLSLDIYILLIPYFTFVPAELLLLKLLIVGEKANNPSITSSKWKVFKAIKIFAYILIVLIIGFCLFAIISIGESLSTDENLETAGLFGRSLAQDWILTPLIFMILTAFVQNDQIIELIKSKDDKNKAQGEFNKTSSSKKLKSTQVAPFSPNESESKKEFLKQVQSPKDTLLTHNLDTENAEIIGTKNLESDPLTPEDQKRDIKEASKKGIGLSEENLRSENQQTLELIPETEKSLICSEQQEEKPEIFQKDDELKGKKLDTLGSLEILNVDSKNPSKRKETKVQTIVLDKGKIMMSLDAIGPSGKY